MRQWIEAHLIGRLVLAKPDVSRVSQEVVGRPGQIGDLGDKLQQDPAEHGPRPSGEPKRVLRGVSTLRNAAPP